MDCLKKAIKIADKCMTEVKNIYLFINILNKYLYYYYIDAEFITTEDINNLIELIKEHIDQSQGDDQQMKDALKYLKNTKEAMKARTLGE
jgi:vacuolar protein sorting-associated protein 35